eukprot:CAMPEP_0196789880 /NCGR_PEP_ID=MMETSP1104-20130614/27315_1 /TAXON_ID=33652 /ORGANISM="Cafeteria sp., Strain Caron Lab Isolate" /LENGTH=49 /DNA_ID= /DNA_START= /DNA_END= /DNA_ORIENTATION=
MAEAASASAAVVGAGGRRIWKNLYKRCGFWTTQDLATSTSTALTARESL